MNQKSKHPAERTVTEEQHSVLANQAEEKNFLKTALAWNGSATPLVLPRVIIAAIYASLIWWTSRQFPQFSISITPFEYSGAVLGLLLVARVNAGTDRWWEARKIWGSIVNASRNLAIIGTGYRPKQDELGDTFLNWVAAWPHVMRDSLRRDKLLTEVEALVGKEEADRIRAVEHMPTYVGARIADLLRQMREEGLDDFAFVRAERERALLIDGIGACERIRNTPIPLVLAINIRRFILLFLILLPIALVERADFLTPLVMAFAAYPLFSLDEIGAELQNPFSPRNLSHLPLQSICATIQRNVLEVKSSRV